MFRKEYQEKKRFFGGRGLGGWISGSERQVTEVI
jgi:hypothetical protein